MKTVLRMTAPLLLAAAMLTACGGPKEEPVRPAETPAAAKAPESTAREAQPAGSTAPAADETPTSTALPTETPGPRMGQAAWKYTPGVNHPRDWRTAGRTPETVLAEAGTLLAGGENYLDAVDAATGRNTWIYRGKELLATAAGDRNVYLGTGPGEGYTISVKTEERMLQHDGPGVHAVDAATGEERWSLETGRRVRVLEAREGRVYAAADHELHALRADTGEKIWTFRTEKNPFTGRIGSLAAQDGEVFMFLPDGERLLAASAATGEKLWEAEAPGLNGMLTTGGPLIAGQRSGEESGVRALDPGTGAELWSYRTGVETHNLEESAQHDGRILYLETLPQSELRRQGAADAVSLETGEMVRRYTPSRKAGIYGISLGRNGMAFTLTQGDLEIFGPTVEIQALPDGETVWQSGGMAKVLARTEDGNLLVAHMKGAQSRHLAGTLAVEEISPDTGQVLWAVAPAIAGADRAWLEDGMLYVVINGFNAVHAFRR